MLGLHLKRSTSLILNLFHLSQASLSPPCCSLVLQQEKSTFPLKAGLASPELPLCTCSAHIHLTGSWSQDPFLCRYLNGNLAGILSRAVDLFWSFIIDGYHDAILIVFSVPVAAQCCGDGSKPGGNHVPLPCHHNVLVYPRAQMILDVSPPRARVGPVHGARGAAGREGAGCGM